MNHINQWSLSVLAIFAFAAGLRAQQPTPPPDTVFPLGGLTTGEGPYESTANTELRNFGMNMLYNGLSLGPGQGGIVDQGTTGTNGVCLDFFLGNASTRGYNPYYLESDIDLVSNESGDAAWDLNNSWYTPQWSAVTTYRQGQLVMDKERTTWDCLASNIDQQLPTGSNNSNAYWAKVTVPWSTAQWDDGTPYQPQPDNTGTYPEVNFYEDGGWENPFLNSYYYYVDNRTNQTGKGHGLNPMDLPFANTTWIDDVACTSCNIGQPPLSGRDQWTQLATKAANSGLGGPSGKEWDIPFTTGDQGKTYLDYTFYANGPLTNGSGDFLGGGDTLFLDFISRLDDKGNINNYANLPTSNCNGTTSPDCDQVYEIDATAHFIEQSSTDNGATWWDIADEYVPPANLDPSNLCDPNNKNCVCITYGDYGDNITTAKYGNDYNTELHNIINFPNPNLSSTYTSPNPYSVYRLAFSLPQTGGTGPSHPKWDSLIQVPPTTGTIYKTTITSIHFALKCGQYGRGIFVRGVRLRTGGADELLRGKLNNANSSIELGPRFVLANNPNGPGLYVKDNDPNDNLRWPGISSIWPLIKSNFSTTAWNHLIGVNAANENDWPEFRTYAYLNNLWRKWTKAHGGQKDIYTIITSAGSQGGCNLCYLRAIYEDQNNGDPSPAFQNETLFFGQPKRLPHVYSPGLLFPGDAIPSEVKNHQSPNFHEFGLGITGWNNSTYDKTYLSGGTNGNSTDNNDYQHYTDTFQVVASVISSVNQVCAESCYPQNLFPQPGSPSLWTSFYAYPSLLADQDYTANGIDPSFSVLANQNIHDANLNTVSYSDLQTTYFNSGDLENAFDFIFHPPTPQEIREETWDGITWGAKGIIYNAIGDDGSDNIGLCGNNWDTSANSGFSNVADGDLITVPPYHFSEMEITDCPDNNGTDCKYWNLPVTRIPGYYGMKDRSDGVKRSTADIAPIGWELKKLQWVTSYNYGDYILPITGHPNNLNTGAPNYAWASGTGPNDGNHPTGDLEFPLNIDASCQVDQQYNPSTNTFPNTSVPFTHGDITDESTTQPLYYNIGVFHDPNDPDAVYVTTANRRTWPIIYNSNKTAVVSQDYTSGTPYYYLGAIDARMVDFKLKSSWSAYNSTTTKVNWSTNYSYFKITNLRTGQDFLGNISTGQLTTGHDYDLELDPGEGTLLRVAPATAVEVGRTPYVGMAYNNGHHMCDISDPCNAHDHGVVWEDNGKIMFCRTQNENANPIGEYTSKTDPYKVQTVYDPGSDHTQDGHNPSIACKDDTVGVVYSIDDFVDNDPHHQMTRRVVFRMSDHSSNYHTWTLPIGIPIGQYITPPLVKDLTGNVTVNGATTSYDILTPVITPSVDGYIVAFTELNAGIEPFLINTTGLTVTYLGLVQTPGSGHQYRMISLASRPELVTGPWGGNAELINLAWEVDHIDGTSDIDYQPYYHPQGVPVWANGGSPTIISGPCLANRHPMVAVKPPAAAGQFGMPVVTWECGGESLLREMTSWGTWPSTQPTWSSYWGFWPAALRGNTTWEFNNLPLPSVRIENALCGGNYAGPLFKELIYQDTFNHFERIDRYKINSLPTPDWTNATKLKEYAQFGSVSMPYGNFLNPAPLYPLLPNMPFTFDNDLTPDPGVISYRGIWADENNEYAAEIVASPPAETSVSSNLVETFKWMAGAACEIAVGLQVGPSIAPPPCCPGPPNSPTITWSDNPIGAFQETPTSDSTSILTETAWPIVEDSIRTDNFPTATAFSLNMNRVLVVDTTNVQSMLPDASHWISYKLVVKDSATHVVTQVLDSAIVTGPSPIGFSSEPGISPNDTTIKGEGYNVSGQIQPTQSGSAYITIIITKDNSTQASLIQEQIYCDSLELPSPVIDSSSDSSGGPAPKMAHPSSTADTAQLVVTVHPNPVTGIVKVCVEDVPGGVPVTVDVVNQMGVRVADLYDATPDAELGLCLSLDCSKLPSGIYYADLQVIGMHKAVKFSVEH